MVDHNQKQVETIRQWEVGNKINRQLLKWASTGGGERQKCGDHGVSVDLHLLTKGTASNKMVHKGGHTWTPIVVSQCEVQKNPTWLEARDECTIATRVWQESGGK